MNEGSQTIASRGLLEKAGPRELIYFDPSKVHAGIVTCGGLCPGLNNVIRSAVMTLWYRYGVRRISGIRYGYRGLFPDMRLPVKELNPEVVSDIHRFGGTVLGSSRGGGDQHRSDRRCHGAAEPQPAVHDRRRRHAARGAQASPMRFASAATAWRSSASPRRSTTT